MSTNKPWHKGPTHCPDTHFILQILDDPAVATDDDATAADPLPERDGNCAGNFTSDSVEKSIDMPDRGTTLVPFRVRPGEEHPPPPPPPPPPPISSTKIKLIIFIKNKFKSTISTYYWNIRKNNLRTKI